jgi:hypothetical protein
VRVPPNSLTARAGQEAIELIGPSTEVVGSLVRMGFEESGNVAAEIGRLWKATFLGRKRQIFAGGLGSFESGWLSGQDPIGQGANTPYVRGGSWTTRPSENLGCSPEIGAGPLGKITFFMGPGYSKIDQHSRPIGLNPHV